MYIQCTQKLLAKLRQPYGRLPVLPDPIYCWHANFFEYRGLVHVVMTNDLDGSVSTLEVESFKDFDKQILETLRSDMEYAGASEIQISKYLKDAGPVMFGPTSDRSKTARVTALTRTASESFSMTQSMLDQMTMMASNLAALSDSEAFGEEVPTSGEKPDLEARKDESEFGPTLMVTLDVELQMEGVSKVTRSFILPIEITFATLHEILQIGFEWGDENPHEFDFSQYGFKVGPIRNKKRVLPGTPGWHDESDTMLSDLLPSIRSFTYRYDCGVGWDHVIRVGKTEFVDRAPYVECTGGVGNGPPDYCEGPSDFAEMLEILKDPTHKKYNTVFMWEGYDFINGFDKESLNQEFGELEFITEYD